MLVKLALTYCIFCDPSCKRISLRNVWDEERERREGSDVVLYSKALAHFLQIKVWMGDPTVHKFPTIVPPTPIDLQGSTTMKLENLKRRKIEFTFFSFSW